jgi:hypothetical protein
MTRIESIQMCLDLWTWLRDNPGKSKMKWPGWNKKGSDLFLGCPACAFARKERAAGTKPNNAFPDGSVVLCYYCPVWTGTSTCVDDGYMKWPVSENVFPDLVIKMCKERLQEQDAVEVI